MRSRRPTHKGRTPADIRSAQLLLDSLINVLARQAAREFHADERGGGLLLVHLAITIIALIALLFT